MANEHQNPPQNYPEVSQVPGEPENVLSADAYTQSAADMPPGQSPGDPYVRHSDEWLRTEAMTEGVVDEPLLNLLIAKENIENARVQGVEEGRDVDYMHTTLQQLKSHITARRKFLAEHPRSD